MIYCPECNDRLKSVQSITEDYVTYRKKVCKNCFRVFYTFEDECIDEDVKFMLIKAERKRAEKYRRMKNGM